MFPSAPNPAVLVACASDRPSLADHFPLATNSGTIPRKVCPPFRRNGPETPRCGARRNMTRGAGDNMTPEKNLELMKTLDDSWNSQDLTVFRKRHTKNCIIRWPNQPPTHGIAAHEQEAIAFFQTFPDQHLVNNPYKVMIAKDDWTCTIAEFTGTMKGPMKMPDGSSIPPTNKAFKVDFCTVAHWNENGEIVEENLFYDLMGMLTQIGVLPGKDQEKAA